MTKPTNLHSIEKATSKAWSDWVRELDQAGARSLSHAELAREVKALLGDEVKSPDWWAQGITVAYEQHIGRRIPGQLSNGLFEIAVSKTVQEASDDLFPKVVEWFESQSDLKDQKFTNSRSSQTPRRSNWRCDFADKSKFLATVEENGNKSKLVLSHTAIPTKVEADSWKKFWKSTIDDLA